MYLSFIGTTVCAVTQCDPLVLFIKVQDCVYCIVLEKNAWYIAIEW